jgi:hypothetical protein
MIDASSFCLYTTKAMAARVLPNLENLALKKPNTKGSSEFSIRTQISFSLFIAQFLRPSIAPSLLPFLPPSLPPFSAATNKPGMPILSKPTAIANSPKNKQKKKKKQNRTKQNHEE